ncbi:putative reverse transcriptase domain-containing protein [Tanacetum coccineum]
MAPKRTMRLTPASTTPTTTSITNAYLKAMIDQGVNATLAARDSDRSMNGDDNHNSGTGVRRTELVAQDKCYVENQIKFATYTLLGSALTWWNSHVKTVGHNVSYAMTWTNLKNMMTDKYCPRGEIKKLEAKMWNLKVKGTNVDAIEFATELMDKKICTFAERQSENKRKETDNLQQQQNKRQNTGRAYAAGSSEKKPYGGSKPLCAKCNYHHDGQCQKPTCYECGAQRHFKRDCPKLKNNNRGNQGGNGNAPVKVYAVGRTGTNPDSNVVTGMFLLNNRYAFVLFDTGADRSFVSTVFSSQIDITPSTLDHFYDVELVDGRIIRLNTIIRGCTLNFLNHPFNIDLMPVELGSFDVIIGMDWLAKYQTVTVCAEKIVRIPWGNETLIVRGDKSDRGNETCLNIISCTKTQKLSLSIRVRVSRYLKDGIQKSDLRSLMSVP